ncbi:hypothetical protein [Dawidia cretensis]|nr:hypothetical protein [Dawidia cretensis]
MLAGFAVVVIIKFAQARWIGVESGLRFSLRGVVITGLIGA